MRVGDQILCIKDDGYTPAALKLISNFPVLDKLYTVRDVLNTRNGRGLHLEEITNPLIEHPSQLGLMEPSFSVTRFRKISDFSESTRVGNKVEAGIAL